MQRPVMDPMYLREQHDGSRHARLAAFFAGAGRALRWTGRQLIRQPFRFRRKRGGLLMDDETFAGKLVRGMVYRMMFVPILLSLSAGVFVFCGTHPMTQPQVSDPTSQGVYFDPISIASDDGTQLQAWLVPVIDARRVLLHKEHLLRQRHPAVVLVHDYGQSPQQMLPLLAPLHDDGMVVVAVGLRGVGAGRTSGQTFGINESQDVLATVNMLRRRPFVDPERIAVLGVGTGANAAMLAAERDGRIAAVVVADPIETPAAAIARYVGPDRFGTRWMQPVNRWAFQAAYRVDLEDMNANRFAALAAGRPTLRVDRQTDMDGKLIPMAVDQVRAFFTMHLKPRDPAPHAAPAGPKTASPAKPGKSDKPEKPVASAGA